MSTQTLTKARHAGAQEQQSAPTALLPELTAKSKLARGLNDYRVASSDISEYQARIARCDRDEQEAIDAVDVPVADSSARIARIQSERNIYKARLAAKEEVKAKLFGELKPAVKAGFNEYSVLAREVLSRRCGILRGRIIEAGQLDDSVGAELDYLLESCKPVADIRRMEISSQSLLYCDSAEQLVSMGQSILDAFEAIETKAKEEI